MKSMNFILDAQQLLRDKKGIHLRVESFIVEQMPSLNVLVTSAITSTVVRMTVRYDQDRIADYEFPIDYLEGDVSIIDKEAKIPTDIDEDTKLKLRLAYLLYNGYRLITTGKANSNFGSGIQQVTYRQGSI